METVIIFMLLCVLWSIYIVYKKLEKIEDLITEKGGAAWKSD